jgi:lipopolysaccharide biosynthesis glycosyltransferase
LWKKNGLHNKVISFVEENNECIKFVDQCGLNAIIDGDWIKIPLKFNQQAVIFKDFFNEKYNCFSEFELEEAKKNPVVIHYTGSSKPWHFMNNHPYKYLYWQYLKKTPFNRLFPEDLTVLNIVKKSIPEPVKSFIKRFLK